MREVRRPDLLAASLSQRISCSYIHWLGTYMDLHEQGRAQLLQESESSDAWWIHSFSKLPETTVRAIENSEKPTGS